MIGNSRIFPSVAAATQVSLREAPTEEFRTHDTAHDTGSMSRKKASSQKPPSLASFARQADPFTDSDLLLQRLRLEASESRFLEWKGNPPVSPAVALRTKYRMVKAMISFANTEGGFVIFGVDSKGQWVGFSESDLVTSDAAALAELINGCVQPELAGLNYTLLRNGGRLYPVLHTPPSTLMPHVTTKDIQEKLPDGKHVFHINKFAVYCRYGAKSDLATPAQFARIIAARTDMLRSEVLRRVREVKIPVVAPGARSGSGRTILRVKADPEDTSLPAVRITRNPNEASGVLVQEELSEALFDEINNVLHANSLLAKGRARFVFGQEIYYRVYAERQHVELSQEVLTGLVQAAIQFYAPMCYWFIHLPPDRAATIIEEALRNEKTTQNRLICRLAILVGPKTTAVLKGYLDKVCANHPQPGDYYFSFKKMLTQVGAAEPRLIALQRSTTAMVQLPAEGSAVSTAELLTSSQRTSNSLSKACMAVFSGDFEQKQLCRQLDILAHGADLAKLDAALSRALSL